MERFKVSQDLIEQYREEGAVCVKGAFNNWVPRLLSAHARLQELLETVTTETATGKAAKIENADGYPPLSYGASNTGHFGIRNAVYADSDFEAWMKESPAADIVGQVIGAKTIQFWWDQSFCKVANAEAAAQTPWHTDAGSFSWDGNMLPSFWIAGTDIKPENAPLVTVVGSHKDTRWFRPVFGKDDVPLSENYAELDEIHKALNQPEIQTRTWTVGAGDCLIIHPRTYHASTAPRANASRRIAFTSRWLGDDIRWNKREMTFDYPDDMRFENVVQGEPAPVDDFPVIWHAD